MTADKVLGTPAQRAQQVKDKAQSAEPGIHVGATSTVKTVLPAPVRGNKQQRARIADMETRNTADAAAQHAIHTARQERSTPLNPTWAPRNPLLGVLVWYVMPDGTDRNALVLAVHDGDQLTLNVKVALDPEDKVQSRQFTLVPKGQAGAPGTWREQP